MSSFSKADPFCFQNLISLVVIPHCGLWGLYPTYYFFLTTTWQKVFEKQRLEKVWKYSNFYTYELVEREKLDKVRLLELPTHHLPNWMSASRKQFISQHKSDVYKLVFFLCKTLWVKVKENVVKKKRKQGRKEARNKRKEAEWREVRTD